MAHFTARRSVAGAGAAGSIRSASSPDDAHPAPKDSSTMTPDGSMKSPRAAMAEVGFERLDGLDQVTQDELRDTLDELIWAKEALDQPPGERSTVAADDRVSRAQAAYVAALERLRRAPPPASASLFDPPSHHAVWALRHPRQFIQRGIDDDKICTSAEYVSTLGGLIEAAKTVLDPEVIELDTIAPPEIMSFEEDR